MTDQLLQKIEEKIMTLLTELETLRNELHHFKQENSQLKTEKNASMKKLQTLITTLDSLDNVDSLPAREFELVQNSEEVAESAIA